MPGNRFLGVVNDFLVVVNRFGGVGNGFLGVGDHFLVAGNDFLAVGEDILPFGNDFLAPGDDILGAVACRWVNITRRRVTINFRIEPVLIEKDEKDPAGFLEEILNTGEIIYQTQQR